MTKRLLSLLGEKHPLTACDAGEFSGLKAGGMTFTVEATARRIFSMPRGSGISCSRPSMR